MAQRRHNFISGAAVLAFAVAVTKVLGALYKIPLGNLLDKEGMDAEQLQRIWREVEALSESVRDGYVSAPDLIRVLREEYEIDIIGG